MEWRSADQTKSFLSHVIVSRHRRPKSLNQGETVKSPAEAPDLQMKQLFLLQLLSLAKHHVVRYFAGH